MVRWAGHVAHIGEMRNAYKILVETPEGKRPLGRPRRSLEDNIKVGIKEIGCEVMDWIHLAQNRSQWRDHENTVTKFIFHKRLKIS
jgi:hypothetical protein